MAEAGGAPHARRGRSGAGRDCGLAELAAEDAVDRRERSRAGDAPYGKGVGDAARTPGGAESVGADPVLEGAVPPPGSARLRRRRAPARGGVHRRCTRRTSSTPSCASSRRSRAPPAAAAIDNYIIRRGALLHGDVPVLAPFAMAATPESRSSSRTEPVPHGHLRRPRGRPGAVGCALGDRAHAARPRHPARRRSPGARRRRHGARVVSRDRGLDAAARRPRQAAPQSRARDLSGRSRPPVSGRLPARDVRGAADSDRGAIGRRCQRA